VTRIRGAMYQWFTYDKSGRKGPFKTITKAMLKKGAGWQWPEMPYYESQNMVGSSYIDYGSNDTFFIVFKGKKIGPFQEVSAMSLTPDETKFYAVVSKNGKWHFMSSDGRDILLDGKGFGMIMSPDGTKAIASGSTVKEDKFYDYLYTIEGKKIGPLEEVGDFWFLANSNHWVYTDGNNVYYDGALLKKFPETINKQNFWIDDTSHYAWGTTDKIAFSDGTSFPYPVMMRVEKKGGRTYLCWVSLKQNGDVMFYSRAL